MSSLNIVLFYFLLARENNIGRKASMVTGEREMGGKTYRQTGISDSQAQ
jgi:hypothetical protein